MLHVFRHPVATLVVALTSCLIPGLFDVLGQ